MKCCRLCYAKHLAPCLGTVLTEPVAVGAGEEQPGAIKFSGRPLSAISRCELKELLSGNKNNPLVKLRSLRDQTLNDLNSIKEGGNKAQLAFWMPSPAAKPRCVNWPIVSPAP